VLKENSIPKTVLVLRTRSQREVGTTPVCSCLPIRSPQSCLYDGAVMETAQLQLIFNVVAITGVSSLASFCYLLRKDNRKLAAERQAGSKEVARLVAVERPTVIHADPDIRNFAADRRTHWVSGMAAARSRNQN